MKVLKILINAFVLNFVGPLLVTTFKLKSLLFKKISPIFVFGVLLGSASTTMYHFLMAECGMHRDSQNGFYKNNVQLQSSFKLENETNNRFINLIAPSNNYTIKNYSGHTSLIVNFSNEDDDTELADTLFKQIRILCFILTQPKNHQTQARAVRETWGKRCNVFYFVSTGRVVLEEDPSVTTVVYEGKESRASLWYKTKAGFKHAYDNHFDDVDWFVKADDDTYLIMENMRMFLLDKDTSLPIYYGNRVGGTKLFSPFIGGGTGYILSKEALRRLAEEAFDPQTRCNQIPFGGEDLEMGCCLKLVNVKIGDARDHEGKPRFQHTKLEDVLNARPKRVSRDFILTKDTFAYGKNCCSDSIISMHYVTEKMMKMMELFIYNVHPFGIISKLSGLNHRNEVLLYINNKPVKKISKNVNPKFPIVLGKYLT